jgi:hypothetical protein
MSSANLTYAVYAAIAALWVLWIVFTFARRTRYVTADGVAARLMRGPIARWVVWASWAFVGWHLFVRGRGAFE